MKIKVTYFKESGKFYACGEHDTQETYFYKIIDEVKDLNPKPGLSGDWDEGTILIEGDEIPPHLIFPTKYKYLGEKYVYGYGKGL